MFSAPLRGGDGAEEAREGDSEGPRREEERGGGRLGRCRRALRARRGGRLARWRPRRRYIQIPCHTVHTVILVHQNFVDLLYSRILSNSVTLYSHECPTDRAGGALCR